MYRSFVWVRWKSQIPYINLTFTTDPLSVLHYLTYKIAFWMTKNGSHNNSHDQLYPWKWMGPLFCRYTPNFAVNCEIYAIETVVTQIWPRLWISEKWRKNSEYKCAQLTSSPHAPEYRNNWLCEANRDEFCCHLAPRISWRTAKFRHFFARQAKKG